VNKKLLLPVTLFLALAAAVTLMIGCKQAEGERCQVTADCEDGLQCNQGTNPPSCQRSVGGGIDATVPDMIDAPPVDDMPVDAIDAMPDA
jgi:hypothetical protein